MAGYAQSVQRGNEQCMTGGYYDQYIAVSLFHSSHFSSTLARVFHGWQFLQENLSVLVQALHRLQNICSTMEHLILPLWHFCFLCCFHSFLFPSFPVVLSSLKYVFMPVGLAWLTDSAVSCGDCILKASGTTCVQQRAAHDLFCRPLLPTPWHLHPTQPPSSFFSPMLILWRWPTQWSCYHWLAPEFL